MATRKPATRTATTKAPAPDTRSVKLAPVERMTSAQIAPVATYQGASVARARDVAAPSLGPASLMGPTYINRTEDGQIRSRQLQFADALREASEGRGPSVAGIQMQEGTNRAIQQQMGALAAARLRNPAQAARLAARTGSSLQQQSVLDSAKLRMAEAIDARARLGETLNQTRSTDASIATNQAGLDATAASNNQTAINARDTVNADNALKAQGANQAADLQTNQYQAQVNQQAASENAAAMNTRATNQAGLEQQAATNNQTSANTLNQTQGQIDSDVLRTRLSGEFGKESARISGAASTAAAQAGAWGQVQSQQVAQDGANYRNDSTLAVNVGNNVTSGNQTFDKQNTGASSAAVNRTGNAMASAIEGASKSDERAKKNIEPVDKALDELLSKIRPSKFEYKDPAADGEGTHVGVMAQDLEKSDAGRTMVDKDEKGDRWLNWKKGMGVILASQARLNQRLSQLEGARA